MGYASRLPTPNDPPGGEWIYGPQPPHDDFSALLNSIGRRCEVCRRVTMNKYLNTGRCPECSERCRSESQT